MLTPQEITVGALDAVPLGLTLVLPRSDYEQSLLVIRGTEESWAIFLHEDYQFVGFKYDQTDRWKGALVPGVSIEVDETSLFDADTYSLPSGVLVRSGTILSIAFRLDNGFSRQGALKIPLASGLVQAPPQLSVGFRSWQIVLGTGLEKRVLKQISIPTGN